MKIGLIGSGNVASHLGNFFQAHGHKIVQVYNRTATNGQILASTLFAQYIPSLQELDFASLDMILLAISDQGIDDVISQIPEKSKAIIVHTSGATPLDMLSRFKNYGVIYPPQSLNKHVSIDLGLVPFAVEGSSENIQKSLLVMMQHMAPTSFLCTSQQRLALHISSVFANNFTNTLYQISYDILKQADLPFELIAPLIRETAEKVQNHIPKQVQTGPAARNDTETIYRHLQFLSNKEELTEIYQQLTSYIKKRK